MKTFKEWIQEDAPTNCSAGTGVRGFGDVTGTPAGSISNYAAANAADSAAIAAKLGLTTNNTDALPDFEDEYNGLVTTKALPRKMKAKS